MSEIAALEQKLVELKKQLATVESQSPYLPENALIPLDTPADKALEVASRLATEELARRQQLQAEQMMRGIAVNVIQRHIDDTRLELESYCRKEIGLRVEARRQQVRKKQSEISKLTTQLVNLLREVKAIAGCQEAQNDFYNAAPSPESGYFFSTHVGHSGLSLPELVETNGTFKLSARTVMLN